MQLTNPAWWATVVSTVLTFLGVSDPGMQENVKMVITAGGAIVIAVYTWSHHKTVQNADTAAASIRRPIVIAPVASDPAPAVPPTPAGAVPVPVGPDAAEITL